MAKKEDIIQLHVLNVPDDVHEDGSTLLLRYMPGPELNQQWRCSCIWEMVSPYQLFHLLMNEDPVFVTKEQLLKYCKLVTAQPEKEWCRNAM